MTIIVLKAESVPKENANLQELAATQTVIVLLGSTVGRENVYLLSPTNAIMILTVTLALSVLGTNALDKETKNVLLISTVEMATDVIMINAIGSASLLLNVQKKNTVIKV
mmetsp:Transcript_33147/g.34455  ORF Transcript_33147/g.34455 Transcript_33147/m.34455 type:complete len:110 (+) Transcript_33147:297-626(+)